MHKKTIGRRNFCTLTLETQMHLHRKAFTKFFVLQSLHKALPSTTLYCRACTEYFPVLLCTAKLAQSTSQYYFVVQSLPQSISQFYKACTRHFPVLLCTAKLAQSTSMYYFVLQSLHKALPSSTLYYKACAENLPVLLCTRKVAHNTSQNTSSFDTQQAFSIEQAFTHGKLLLHKECITTQQAFTQQAFTQQAFTHSNIHAAMTLCFAASRSKPASPYTHGNTR